MESPSGREQPGQEVDRGDGHADAEQHTGKNALRSALAEGESQTRDDDGDEGQTAGDGTGEGLLQDVYRVFPWRVRLGERGRGERESKERYRGDARNGKPLVKP